MADVKWVKKSIDCSELTDTMRDVADTGESIAAILDAVATLLEAIAALLVFPDNPLKAIINLIIDAISAFIEDLLSNNVALAIHHNLQFDPRWRLTAAKAEEDPTRSSGRSPNLEDGDIPFYGTGLTGWFGGLLASVRSRGNPWAPVQNDDANCGMFVLVYGANSLSEFQDLIPLIKDLMFNWDEEKWQEFDPQFWKDKAETRRHLARLGSAFGCKSVGGEAIFERESAWESIQSGVADRMGDVLSFPDNLLSAESMPVWRSIPIARILGPPVQEILEALRDLLNGLKFPVWDGLRQLIEMLAKKVAQISVIIAKISGIIDALAALIDFLTQVNIILIPPAKDTTGASEPFLGNGGITGCMIDALSADEAPDFGSDGVVFGTVALINFDTGIDSLLVLGVLLGMDIEELLTAAMESQLEAVDEALEGVEDAAGDATWNNVAPVAKAGDDQELTAIYDETDPDNPVMDLIVTVNGTESSDANDDPLTYVWSVTSIPAGSAVTTGDITGPTSAVAVFPPDVVGEYVLTLEVDDGTVSDTDTIAITIVDP